MRRKSTSVIQNDKSIFEMSRSSCPNIDSYVEYPKLGSEKEGAECPNKAKFRQSTPLSKFKKAEDEESKLTTKNIQGDIISAVEICSPIINANITSQDKETLSNDSNSRYERMSSFINFTNL